MRPSERIRQLAIEQHKRCIDPGWNGNVPDEVDYVNAIINFLDENPPPVYSIQPVPEVPKSYLVETSDNTLDSTLGGQVPIVRT